MTKDQKIAALIKNGISPADLKTSYDEGYRQGWRQGVDGTYQICFAAVILALRELHNFNQDQLCGVAATMQEHIVHSLTSVEAVQEVYKQTGLILDLLDPTGWLQLEDD